MSDSSLSGSVNSGAANARGPNIGEPSSALVSALRRILRPLVKLLLSQGITFPFLANLLKSIFVETALKDFPVEGKRQTDSRISLLTGVHRKDVRRLRDDSSDAEDSIQVVSLGAQLVSQWLVQDEYTDSSGNPLPLARLDKGSGKKSFESLVESVSRRDIRSRVVLDEWIQLGVVHIDDEDCVVLNVDAFIPEKGFDEKAYYFGKIIHDHIATGAENILSPHPPNFDRCTYCDGLTKASITELADMSSELGMELLKTINRRAMELKEADCSANGNDMRMNLGIFYHNTLSDDEKVTE